MGRARIKTREASQARATGGGKQEDQGQVPFLPKKEMETGQRGVLSSHRACTS